ncbi:ATP-binding protein [Virgibacillus oceani]
MRIWKKSFHKNHHLILPILTQDSQFDVMSIYQLAGVSNTNFQVPPFRDPHHSASAVSLIGGTKVELPV